MTWKQVDFTARELRLEPGSTKNNLGRTFPFIVELEAVLVGQRDYTDSVQMKNQAAVPYVFHRDGTQIRVWRRSWTTALLNTGLATKDPVTKKVTRLRRPHDFRRTAIRALSRAGITEAVAMQMCGHETRSVFDRYNIVTGGDLRAAAAKLDAASCAAGKVSGKVAPISRVPRKRRAAN